MKPEEIDRRIGLPDVDTEWKIFEREVICAPSRIPVERRSNRRIAAIVAIVLSISLTALASVYYVSVIVPARRVTTPKTAVTYGDTLASQPTPKDTANFFIFDNIEMKEIAQVLGDYYGVKTVFKNEDLKSVRLYARIEKEKSMEEVVALLNNFRKVKIYLNEDTLYIERRSNN